MSGRVVQGEDEPHMTRREKEVLLHGGPRILRLRDCEAASYLPGNGKGAPGEHTPQRRVSRTERLLIDCVEDQTLRAVAGRDTAGGLTARARARSGLAAGRALTS
jgi:hypothetical protein